MYFCTGVVLQVLIRQLHSVAHIETFFISKVTLFGNCLFCYHSNPMPHPLSPTVKSAHNGCHGNSIILPTTDRWLLHPGQFVQDQYNWDQEWSSHLQEKRLRYIEAGSGHKKNRIQSLTVWPLQTFLKTSLCIYSYIRSMQFWLLSKLLECKQWEPLWTVATHCTQEVIPGPLLANSSDYVIH